MTASHQVQCSKCGAALPLEGTAQTVVCRYCGASTLLPPEVWQRLHPPPPMPVVVVAPASSGVGVFVGVAVAIAVIGGAISIAVLAVHGSSRSTGAKGPPPAVALNPVASAGEPCNGRRAAWTKRRHRRVDHGRTIQQQRCLRRNQPG